MARLGWRAMRFIFSGPTLMSRLPVQQESLRLWLTNLPGTGFETSTLAPRVLLSIPLNANSLILNNKFVLSSR
jgi:hypothetical protein